MNTLLHLSLFAASLSIPGIGQAQTVSPAPAPTMITTAPYTITRPGYYQLGADLVYAGNSKITNDAIITINASNVTLDFAGHYISGPSGSPTSQLLGVFANERGNLNIQNGTIAYCFQGIYLNGNGSNTSLNINQRITNMLISYCYNDGINLSSASNVEATNNRISFTGGTSLVGSAHAILLYGGSGNQIVNNNIATVTGTTDTTAGIEGANNFIAIGNVISNVTAGSGVAVGIYEATFAVSNSISNASFGLYDCTKYQNTLTTGCNTPYDGGTAVGTNN